MSDEDDLTNEDDLAVTEQPTVDAGSARGVRSRKREIDRERREGDDFWRRMLNDPIGRRELWRMLADLHTFEVRFACGPNGFPQPEATWFQLAEYAYGQRLYLSWSRIDRAAVFMMHDEHDPRFAKPKAPRKRPE